jgi:hypothetical protein
MVHDTVCIEVSILLQSLTPYIVAYFVSPHKWTLNYSHGSEQKNHLSGLRKSYLKLSFDTVQQLMNVRNDLMHVVERNKAKSDAAEAYESILTGRR